MRLLTFIIIFGRLTHLRLSQALKVLRDFFFTASEIVTLRRDKNAYVIITIIIINLLLLLVIMAFYAHVCL